MCDITDKEFEKTYLSFYNNVNDYLNKYVIPDLVAFYLANAYSRHCLSESNLINYINSAIDVFNCRCDISRLIPNVKEILLKSRTLSDEADRVFKYGLPYFLRKA